MGHEFAGSVEDVGTSCLADPDPRNDLQDGPEINLCDRDRGRVRAPSHRDSYVRLGGLLAEVPWAEVGFLSLCLDKDRLPRKVWSAAQHIHRQPRHPQSLLPPRIQLAQFGDRRRLAKQPEIVQPLLFQSGVARIPGRVCRPADLTLDFLHELLDLRRGSTGLLALNDAQRVAVLLVEQVCLDEPVPEQPPAYETGEKCRVLPKQPSPGWLRRRVAFEAFRIHSLLSLSTRMWTCLGISMPRAFAVLRLTMKSNFKGT